MYACTYACIHASVCKNVRACIVAERTFMRTYVLHMCSGCGGSTATRSSAPQHGCQLRTIRMRDSHIPLNCSRAFVLCPYPGNAKVRDVFGGG
jgi:hypothetical protein